MNRRANLKRKEKEMKSYTYDAKDYFAHSLTRTSTNGSTSGIDDVYMEIGVGGEVHTRTDIEFSSISPILGERDAARLYFVLTPVPGFSTGDFYVGERLYHIAGDPVKIDLSGDIAMLKNGAMYLHLVPLEQESAYTLKFYTSGENAPKFEVEYLIDEKHRPTVISLPMPKGTAARVNVRGGDIIAAFADTDAVSSPLGIGVSHVYNPDEPGEGYGKDFRLNLDEHLEKRPTALSKMTNLSPHDIERLNAFDYVYTDGEGKHYGFEEYFYYIENDVRVYVPAASVTTDSQGELTANGKRITRMLLSPTGWEARTKLESVKQAPLFEQRSDERRQLEEQSKSYGSALGEYVVIDTDTGIEKSERKPSLIYTDSNIALEDDEMLLPFSDAVNYRSLICQKKALISQKASLALNKQSYNLQRESLVSQIDGIEDQQAALQRSLNALNTQKEYDERMRTFYKEKASPEAKAADTAWSMEQVIDYNGSDESVWTNTLNLGHANSHNPQTQAEINAIPNQEALLTAQKNIAIQQRDLISLPKNDLSYTVTNTLIKQLESDLSTVAEQEEICDQQLAALLSRKAQYLDAFRTMLLEYLRMKEQLVLFGELEPVSYLIRDGIVKGFNSNGELCTIFDGYENYVAIDRNTAGQIERVYDKSGNGITLRYENGRLKALKDKNGNRVKYGYDTNGRLEKAEFSNGKILTFEYDTDSNLAEIASTATDIASPVSDFKTVCFEHDEGALMNATLSSSLGSVSHLTKTNGETEITSLTFEYTPDSTTVKDGKDNKERYVFSDKDELSEYYREENGVVVEAKQYSYTAYHNENNVSVPLSLAEVYVMHADESTLYRNPLETYAFSYTKTELIRTDPFGKLTESEIFYPHPMNYSLIQYTKTGCIYDEAHRLIKKTVAKGEREESENGTTDWGGTVTVTEYFYNTVGKCVRTESYIEDKVKTLGKNIEETVYDENGHAVKSFSYNSLDPSSKFYTESVTDESGKKTAEIDATGRYKTAYSYNGSLLRGITYPNGATLAYGYDREGNVNAITQSTAEGEANTNITLYTAGEVTRLTSGNNTVDYAYDGKRRLTSVKLNGASHIGYTYEDNATDGEKKVDKVKATYVGGYTATATYDGFGRLVKTTEGTGENETALTETDYTDDGRVLHKRDITNNTVHSYEYDLRKCLASYTYTETPAEEYGTAYNVTEAINCDDDGSFLSRHAVGSLSDADVSYSYTYKDKRPDTVSASIIYSTESFHVTAKYDALGRSAGKTATLGYITTEESISYLKHGDHATSLPQSVRYAYGSGAAAVWQDKLEYTYDSMGNISEIRENGKLTARYAYDSLNRLIREDNRAMNKTEVLRYDACGNILSRRKWSFTLKPMDELALLPEEDEILYFYSGDKLMSYHGESFAYNAVGNPTTYRGKTLVWEKGRQLKKFHTTSFTYDSFGRRTSKSGSHYDYDVNGKILFDWNGLVFVYDHTGVVGMKYIGNFQTYLFRKDAQGNIIGILDTNGNLVVKYVYDAWGNHKVLDADGNEITDSYHIGRINPYRYRGYYFDEETGLYYLQSRYYDPETGRFLNADTVEYLDPKSINGLNLYAYCGNNPVMYSDPSGHLVITTSLLVTSLIVGAIVGGVAGGIYGGITAAATGQNVFWGAIWGAVGGAIMGAGAGIAALLMAPLLSVTASVSLAIGGTTLTMGAYAAFGVGALLAFGTGAIAGAGMEITGQLINNGGVTNWKSVGFAALEWGMLNTASAFFAALGEAAVIDATGYFTTNILSIALGNIKLDALINFMGMILDYGRSGM